MKNQSVIFQNLHDSLKKSEAENTFKTITDYTNQAICLHDMQGNIEYLNIACTKLLGYQSPDELIGQSIHTFIPQNDKLLFKTKTTHQNSSNKTYQLKHKTKGFIPIGISTKVISTANKLKIISTFTPITKDNKLNQLETLLDLSPVAIFKYSKDGTMISCNKFFEIFHNIPTDKLINHNIYNTLQNKELINKLKDAFTYGAADYTGPFIHTSKPNDWVNIHLRKIPCSENEQATAFGIIENITKEIKAKDQNKKAQRNLEKAERIANIGNWEYNLNTNEIKLSNGSKEILGLRVSFISFATFQKMLLSSSQKRVIKALINLVEHDFPFNIKYKLKQPESKIVLDIHSIAEYDKTNNTIFGVLKDITAEKKQEEALRSSEIRFRTLFTNNRSAMLLIHPLSGRIIEVNQAASNYYGYSVHTLKNMYIQQINTAPESNILDVLLQSKNKNQNHFEFRHKLATGEIRDVEIFSGPVNYKDQTLIYSTIYDITQRKHAIRKLKESEERLRLALHTSQQGLWDYNVSSSIIQVSKEYAIMLGYNPTSFTINLEGWMDLLHPDDKEQSTLKFLNYLSDICIDYRDEFRLRTLSGEYKWILSIGKIVSRDSNNKPVRIIGTHTDISKQKETEHELIVAKEKAIKSNQLKTAFLQNMSHEIRTPMNGIMGFSDLLRNQELNLEERLEYTEIIYRNSAQLLRIVNDILDISKIDTGELDISNSEFNLMELVQETIQFFKPQIEAQHLKFEFIKDIECNSCTIYSDRLRIKQILDNLFNNALKFTQNGFINFGIYADEKYYTIFIEDSGYGIPSEKISNIFNRFEQSHTDLAPGGTGLGLTISKEIANLLNGKLWVSSKEMQGSRFSLSLPRTK